MLNRGAIVLKYKEFAIKWLNDNDPFDGNPGITIEQTNNTTFEYYACLQGEEYNFIHFLDL